mgnify:CR=1 FL=1
MKKEFMANQTKRRIKIIAIILIITAIIVTLAFYIGNEEFRVFFDRYILRKEISQDTLVSIELKDEEKPSIYAYYKYITLLNKNKLETYSSSGKKEYEHDIAVNNPIYSSNNRFLTIAEKGGHSLYLISEANILWQQEIEGNIQKINVNKNGYVTVTITGSSYRTVITTYSPAGKELFKTYLSSTYSLDTDISNDNKYLAIAEINTQGTLIQSSIKIISIEKAQTDPLNSVIAIHNAEANKLLKNIKYQDKNKLVCTYDSSIDIYYEGKNEEVISYDKTKATMASIELNNFAVYGLETSVGLFSNTQIVIKDIQTVKENIYTIKNTVKEILAKDNNIVLNIGSEVQFINTSGWLVKKYISQQEVKDIVLADKIAGIVYKDKIEIVNL